MPQVIYMPRQEDPWEKLLPQIMQFGMQLGLAKMKSNLDLANAKELQAEKYKNFETEKTFEAQLGVDTAAAKTQDAYNQRTNAAIDSSAELPGYTEGMQPGISASQIGDKWYPNPPGKQWDSAKAEWANAPEAKAPPKAEVAEFNGKKYEVYHENGRLMVGKELGEAKTTPERLYSTEEGYVPQSQAAGKRPYQAERTPKEPSLQPTNITYKDGTTGTANFNPKNGKYFEPGTNKDITGEINVRGIPKKEKPSWSQNIMKGAESPPKVDVSSLRNDLIKNGYTEKEADEYIKKAKAARKL